MKQQRQSTTGRAREWRACVTFVALVLVGVLSSWACGLKETAWRPVCVEPRGGERGCSPSASRAFVCGTSGPTNEFFVCGEYVPSTEFVVCGSSGPSTVTKLSNFAVICVANFFVCGDCNLSNNSSCNFFVTVNCSAGMAHAGDNSDLGSDVTHKATVESLRKNCVKARSAARGWLSRSVNLINTLLSQPDIDIVALTDACDTFDQRLNKLDNLQNDLEFVIPEESLEDIISEAGDFRDKCTLCRVNAKKLLAVNSEVNKSTATSNKSISSEIKLPKIDLPKFNGNVLEWQAFWDRFKVTIHDSDIADVQKFTYLLSVVDGEAKSTIKGLTITSEHYSVALELLKTRFGRTDKIIYTHVTELLNLQVGPKNNVASLWKLQDSLLTHVRSLETLGVSGDQYGVILTPLILSRLPHDIRMEWAREGESHESDLAFLLTFLAKEIQRRERSATFKPASDDRRNNGLTPSGTSLLNKAAIKRGGTSGNICRICQKQHKTEKCWELSRSELAVRKDKIEKAHLCFKCLSNSHRSRDCSAKCDKCEGRHHLLLCGFWPNKSNNNDTRNHSDVRTSLSQVKSNSLSKCIFLQMASAEVCGQYTSSVNILFDCGSDRSYITSKVVNKIKPEWIDTENLSYSAFGSTKPTASNMKNIYNLNMKCSDSSCISIQVTEVPVICTPVSCPPVPDELLRRLGDLTPVGIPSGGNIEIDVLIGLDCYWKLVKPNIVSLDAGMAAQDTVFGWMLSGS